MTSATSTSNPSTTVEISEEYPYPSHVIVSNFVTMKLGGKDTYIEWQTQILSLLKRHEMFGFINGESPSPVGNVGDIDAWSRSDSLVKSWIVGSLSEDASRKVENHLTDMQKKTDFTAKDLWDELQRNYGPSASTSDPNSILEDIEEFPYPYPSHVIVPKFVTMKMGGKDTYKDWETQILGLLKSHQMDGFINGELPSPTGDGKGKEEDVKAFAWTTSDSLVKRWIFGSITEEVAKKAVKHLTQMQKKTYFTSKDLWDKLQCSYGPSASTWEWDPRIIVEVGKAYPYPSHVSASSFVTVKLSGRNNYNIWETQMLCLVKSHQMYGFINGQFPRPAGNWEGKVGDMEAWTISDSLVKGWILGSLSENAVNKVVNHLTHKQKKTDFTAEDLWDELQLSYGPSVVREQGAEFMKSHAESFMQEISINKGEGFCSLDIRTFITWLHRCVQRGETGNALYFLKMSGLKPWDRMTNNGNTVLHVAVSCSTKNNELGEVIATP